VHKRLAWRRHSFGFYCEHYIFSFTFSLIYMTECAVAYEFVYDISIMNKFFWFHYKECICVISIFVCNIISICLYSMKHIVDSTFQTISKYFQPMNIAFYVLYGLVVFGIVVFNVEYLMIFKTIIHSFICLFLIVRFHPYREHTLSAHDSQIIFSAAIILMLNMGIIDTIYGYVEKYKIEKRVTNLIDLTNKLHE